MKDTILKNTLIILLALFTVNWGRSQQLYQFNQYLLNNLVLNPAIAGSDQCNVLGVDTRNQWTGFDGAPTTQTVFFHGHYSKKEGLGGILFNDKAGAIKMTGLELAYSYFLVKDKKQLFSLGISPSVMQYTIDQSNFHTEQANDPNFPTSKFTKTTYDLAAGTYYKNKFFSVSLSLKNLLQTKIDIIDSPNNKFVRHIYFNASYNYLLSSKIRLEPSIYLRSIGRPSPQIDFTLKEIYKKYYWFGFGYRLKESMILFAGFDYKSFSLGYGYEAPLTLLRTYTTGSHELFLRYKFCEQLIKRRKKENVYCPVWE